MMNEEDRRLQKQESRISLVESTLEEQQRENDAVVTELRNRIAALEKKEQSAEPGEREKEGEKLAAGCDGAGDCDCGERDCGGGCAEGVEFLRELK